MPVKKTPCISSVGPLKISQKYLQMKLVQARSLLSRFWESKQHTSWGEQSEIRKLPNVKYATVQKQSSRVEGWRLNLGGRWRQSYSQLCGVPQTREDGELFLKVTPPCQWVGQWVSEWVSNSLRFWRELSHIPSLFHSKSFWWITLTNILGYLETGWDGGCRSSDLRVVQLMCNMSARAPWHGWIFVGWTAPRQFSFFFFKTFCWNVLTCLSKS